MKLFLAFLAIIICCSAQTGAYTALTAAQIKASAPVQSLIKAGQDRVISLGQPKNQFKNNDFSVTQVNNAYQQVVSGGTNYKLDVNYTNTAKEAVRATFQGFYNTTSKAVKIVSLTYKVQYPKTNTTAPTTPTTPTTPSNNTTNATTSVDVAELQTNQLLNSLFNFGFSTAVENSVASGSIPKGTYTVSKVNSVTKQTVKNGTLYTFNALVKNGNTTVALAFIVRNQLESYAAKVQPTTA